MVQPRSANYLNTGKVTCLNTTFISGGLARLSACPMTCGPRLCVCVCVRERERLKYNPGPLLHLHQHPAGVCWYDIASWYTLCISQGWDCLQYLFKFTNDLCQILSVRRNSCLSMIHDLDKFHTKTKHEANDLLQSLLKFETILTAFTYLYIFETTAALSSYLQTSGQTCLLYYLKKNGHFRYKYLVLGTDMS